MKVERERPPSPRSPAAGREQSDDGRLVEQLRQGDADAGYRLVREYYPGVYRYLHFLTGRRETAEDLTQETFLQAWRSLDRFAEGASLRPWLHRIAHREFLQALRARRPEASLEEFSEPGEPHAADLAEAMELRALLERLPVEEREMVVLHYLEGYEYREIARITGAPMGRVRQRLFAARERLRGELGEGDLVYLNEPLVPMRQRAWLPLDQMRALETRLGGARCWVRVPVQRVDVRSSDQRIPNTERRTPNTGSEATTEESMERREFLRQAAAGAAGLMLTEPEKEVVDDRLTQKVTCAFKGAALSDLCEKLQSDTGIRVAAGPSVADEKVTLFCEKRPLREVMRQLSRPFGYTWLRSGKPGEYKYELVQDLRSQLLEEELRNRDRSAALVALEQEIDRYRPYLDLSPDEALDRAKAAAPADKALLEKLAGYGWVAIQMYFRLTPPQQVALRAGEELRFSQEPKPGEQLLPPDVARGVLQSLRDVYFYRGPDSFGLALGVQQPAPGQIRPTALPEARATASLSIRETEPGKIALLYQAGTFSHSDVLRNSGGSWRQGAAPLAAGASPTAARPDNRAANARLATQSALQRRVSLQPEGHCGALIDGAAASQSKIQTPTGHPKSKMTSADVLEAIHQAAGLPIVADFYTHLYSPASLTATDEPLFDALNRLADSMRLRWSKDDDWLQFRSAGFYNDRIKEVPNRLLSRWAASRRPGTHSRVSLLSLDALTEISSLTDAQLDGDDMAEGARDCWGLAEWDLARSQVLRPHLRFLAELTPAQRLAAMSPVGLEFTKLSLPQQQRYIALALRFQDQPLQSLEELEGAVLRVEYTQPGGFEWLPPASNMYRWVVPVVPGQNGRRALMPPVRARTREEALAAARRLDPRLLDALRLELRRVQPEIQASQPLAEPEQIVSTNLNLWVVYVPGLSNRRNLLVVDSQSASDLSTW